MYRHEHFAKHTFFGDGKNTRSRGDFQLKPGFHKIEILNRLFNFDGEICELITSKPLDKVEEEKFIKKLFDRMEKTKKPIIVSENDVVYRVDPYMNLQEIRNNIENKKKQCQEYLEEEKKEKERLADQANFFEQMDKKFQASVLGGKQIDEQLWNKLIQENLDAPKKDFIPRYANKNPNKRITSLKCYVAILEDERKKNGKITPESIRRADEKSGLSFHFRGSFRDRDTKENIELDIRSEEKRFWADVILARTWKHGEELLKVEGFNPDEIKYIQTHPDIPTNYTYYENLSYPLTQERPLLKLGKGLIEMGHKMLSVYNYHSQHSIWIRTAEDLLKLQKFKSDLAAFRENAIAMWKKEQGINKITTHESPPLNNIDNTHVRS